MLIDANYKGQPRKLLVQANRNGFIYVLDRTNGKFLSATPFVEKLNWAKGIDEKGRPIRTEVGRRLRDEYVRGMPAPPTGLRLLTTNQPTWSISWRWKSAKNFSRSHEIFQEGKNTTPPA